MKVLLLFTLLFLSKSTFGQEAMNVFEFSKNQLLSNDAYQVITTNKFLDFKNRDTLVKIIDNVIFEKTELNNYFGYKKDWAKIENEDTTAYRKPTEKYSVNAYNYFYTDSTMTQNSEYYVNQYDMRRETNTVYNLKGFVIYHEKKTFFNNILSETESTTNIFDAKNRVVKIVNKTDRKNKEENKQTVIEAVYTKDNITIKSENGSIICQFITNKNSIGFISKLSPRETAKYFFYSLKNKNFELAKEYCSDKLSKEISSYELFNNQVEDVNWLGGSDFYSSNGVRIEDVWEIKFSTSEKQKYNVEFKMLKQNNGWKVNEFKIVSQ